MKKKIIETLLSLLLIFCSCSTTKQSYEIVDAKAGLVEMNASFDQNPNKKTQNLVSHYKTLIGERLDEIIAVSEQFMTYGRPESLLTNLTADVLKAYGDEFLSNGADVGVMNVNGHRSPFPKGEITVGDMYEIYPFDNTVVFLKLKGKYLKQMFDAYARMGGAGISSNVKLTIEKRKVKSVTIDNKEIDDSVYYWIATLDYLADGNNGMKALKKADQLINSGITIRDAMIEWCKEQTRMGNKVASQLDNRIVIIK